MTEPTPPDTGPVRPTRRRPVGRSAGRRPSVREQRRPRAAPPPVPPLAEEAALGEIERWMSAMAPDAA